MELGWGHDCNDRDAGRRDVHGAVHAEPRGVRVWRWGGLTSAKGFLVHLCEQKNITISDRSFPFNTYLRLEVLTTERCSLHLACHLPSDQYRILGCFLSPAGVWELGRRAHPICKELKMASSSCCPALMVGSWLGEDRIQVPRDLPVHLHPDRISWWLDTRSD